MNKTYITPKDTDINLFTNYHKEIWYENEYNRFNVNVKDGDVVFDCGANIGLFTNYALIRGASKVISVEFMKDVYDCLIQNIDQPNKVTTINGAVSDRNGIGEDINHYNFDRLMIENKINFVDFAKIDIEGWEYPLLLNMPDDTMRKVGKWVIEVHDIYNEHNKGEILRILEKFSLNGFVCNYEQIHKNYNIGMLYIQKR